MKEKEIMNLDRALEQIPWLVECRQTKYLNIVCEIGTFVAVVAAAFVIAYTVAFFVFFIADLFTKKQNRFAKRFVFPTSVGVSLLREFPRLTDAAIGDILNHLKIYLLICREYKGEVVAMPSKFVDAAWHSFLRDTAVYEKFCSKAVGRLVQHFPISNNRIEGQHDLARAFDGAKKSQKLNEIKNKIKNHDGLPSLFCIDQKYGHPKAFSWDLAALERRSAEFKIHRDEQEKLQREKQEMGTDGSGAAACGCGGGAC
jgi:hypothetical protein